MRVEKKITILGFHTLRWHFCCCCCFFTRPFYRRPKLLINVCLSVSAELGVYPCALVITCALSYDFVVCVCVCVVTPTQEQGK